MSMMACHSFESLKYREGMKKIDLPLNWLTKKKKKKKKKKITLKKQFIKQTCAWKLFVFEDKHLKIGHIEQITNLYLILDYCKTKENVFCYKYKTFVTHLLAFP